MIGLTAEQALQHVTSQDSAFKVCKTDIRGVTYRVFKNAPTHVASMLLASRPQHQDGALEYLVFEDERWTYDEFCAEVNRMAHALHNEFGVTNGTPVGIAMRNCPELMILTLAIASIGAVTVFVNAWWTTNELDYALKDSQAKLVFGDGDRINRMLPLQADLGLTLVGVRDGEPATDISYSALLNASKNNSIPEVEIEADDDFAILYSSGTTGSPKGVVLTHRGATNAVWSWMIQAVMAPLMALEEPDPNNPAPRPAVLVVTPLFHVTATHAMFLLSIPAGAKVAVMPKWDARKAVEIIRDENITRFLGVPTQSADLMIAARDMGETLDTLSFLGSGGAKRPAAQVEELADLFPNADIATGWGMTETNAIGIAMAGDDYKARPGAAGKLHPPLQDVRFLDDKGNDVPQGEVGEITVKSPCNMRCYLNKPDETAESFQDGWFKTGDLGQIDEDGFITIVDRKKNIIIRGGENIACLDVEGALHRHPAVAEACAFSVPHERLGEVVGAGIQLKPDASATAQDIQAYLVEHIAKFKIPEHIWLQSTPLPRGATDKIDRRVLKAACLKDHT